LPAWHPSRVQLGTLGTLGTKKRQLPTTWAHPAGRKHTNAPCHWGKPSKRRAWPQGFSSRFQQSQPSPLRASRSDAFWTPCLGWRGNGPGGPPRGRSPSRCVGGSVWFMQYSFRGFAGYVRLFQALAALWPVLEAFSCSCLGHFALVKPASKVREGFPLCKILFF